MRKENGSHHSVCTLSRHKQHLHACVPCAHDVCVGYVLCVQLYSTKPQVVIVVKNFFMSDRQLTVKIFDGPTVFGLNRLTVKWFAN